MKMMKILLLVALFALAFSLTSCELLDNPLSFYYYYIEIVYYFSQYYPIADIRPLNGDQL